jgi:hypothetical protein
MSKTCDLGDRGKKKGQDEQDESAHSEKKPPVKKIVDN